ncbi:MAG: FecCD family ABC transporter permease [Rhodothalassiaceae bacterium]
MSAATRLYALLLGLLIALAMLSLFFGPAALSPSTVLRALFLGGDAVEHSIIWEVRLPRVLLAILIGGSLGLSGAALQGLLRNPLAEPGVIGVSASAGLGAVTVLYWNSSGMTFPVSAAAIGAAGVATLLLVILARKDASVLTLILAGVGINSLAGALTALLLNLSPNPFALADMVYWLMGSLADRSFDDVALAAPFILAGGALLLASARGLGALTLGEDSAASLGIALSRLSLLVIIGTAASVGAGVAVAGTIGFVGLVVPHLLRPFLDYDPARLLVPSALGGAVLLLAADLLVRLLPGGQELKLGVVTALVGAPVFLHLVWRTRRRMR